jgi:CubicO group peptidase (beta-lactamase class C family)
VKILKIVMAASVLLVAANSMAPAQPADQGTQSADPLPPATPEETGLSSERLQRIDAVLNEDIQRGQMPGAVVAIARRGKLVYFKAFGFRDKAANLPMTTDTIFNIASMTKPLTTVGALELSEQGRLLVGEPLARYMPKFGSMKVAALDASGQGIVGTVPAAHQITIQDLMRHTSGMIYGGRGATAVHKMYPSGSASGATSMTGSEFLDRLSALPLLYEPGTVWDYGFGLAVR